MYIMLRAMLLTATVLIVSSMSTFAAAYMKFDGVDGESRDKRHERWCDISSWSWGVSQTSHRASGLATGKRQHKPITITKPIDKATPLLMLSLTQNKRIKKIEFEMMRPDATGAENTYFKVTLEDCIITSINHVDDDCNDGDMPVETITFNYEKITWTYETGSLEFYDEWKTK